MWWVSNSCTAGQIFAQWLVKNAIELHCISGASQLISSYSSKWSANNWLVIGHSIIARAIHLLILHPMTYRYVSWYLSVNECIFNRTSINQDLRRRFPMDKQLFDYWISQKQSMDEFSISWNSISLPCTSWLIQTCSIIWYLTMDEAMKLMKDI